MSLVAAHFLQIDLSKLVDVASRTFHRISYERVVAIGSFHRDRRLPTRLIFTSIVILDDARSIVGEEFGRTTESSCIRLYAQPRSL